MKKVQLVDSNYILNNFSITRKRLFLYRQKGKIKFEKISGRFFYDLNNFENFIFNHKNKKEPDK